MSKDNKEVWFQYIISNKQYWANGFTLKRLEKVRPYVLSDEHIMWDLLERHDGKSKTPEEMKSTDVETFNHCIGNFYCSIANKMYDLKILKIK